jgi:4-alpha-glucanotransferase
MSELRLILSLHHHQPLGQRESALEQSYESRYRPFLDVMANRSDIPFALHTSGPLLEWLHDRHPDYIDLLCKLIESGRVEILGDGRFKPMPAMIPHRDRVAQLRGFTEYLQEYFPAKVRGNWLAERVWEQNLVSALVEAGIEYTILSDRHFEHTLSGSGGRIGYYLTADQGRLLKIFPATQMMRDGVAFADPQQCVDFLCGLADQAPGSTVVFADDGERFGGWSNRSDRMDRRKWLERFCDMLAIHRDWLELATFATAADQSVPVGKVYPSDNSYRWRNSLARYPESDDIYTRMLGVSERLAAVESNAESDLDYVEIAREELYRGQCHDAYGNGSSGGVNQPRLRNAVYSARRGRSGDLRSLRDRGNSTGRMPAFRGRNQPCRHGR